MGIGIIFIAEDGVEVGRRREVGWFSGMVTVARSSEDQVARMSWSKEEEEGGLAEGWCDKSYVITRRNKCYSQICSSIS